MTDVTFVDKQTVIDAPWLNGVNNHVNNKDTTEHPASKIAVTPVGNIAATDVQSALAELDNEKYNKTDTVTNATNAVNVTGTIASGATGTTQATNDNSTKIATTAYVANQIAASSGSTVKQIQPVTASVASNALTATLNPTNIDFRSSTLSDGTVNSRTIGSTISVTIPSTATLGTVSGQPSRLALLAIDNAGTVELAVCNLSGTSLDETTRISTTAMSTSATANNVIYSDTARTSVPFRIVGIIDSTQTTAGTWAAAPTMIQGAGGDALKHVGQFQFATLATTSGTSLDVTGIPNWVNRITLVLNGVTMAGTLQLQIGAGSIITSGYTYTQKTFTAAAVAVAGSAAGANWPIQTVSNAKSGTVVLNKSPGTNRWIVVSDVAVDGTVNEAELVGFLSLSGTLDRLRLSSSNTAFSVGSMSIIWE